MAIEQLPNGVKVAFQAGEKTQYDLKPQKDEGTLYFVSDSDKLYLFLGENQVYAPVNVLNSIDPDSDSPVSSKAISNYFTTNILVEHKTGNYQPEEDRPDYVAPHIYLYDDGTAVFYYQMGTEPRVFLADSDLTDKFVSSEKTKAATGAAIAEGLKTVVEIVEQLPESGTENIDKKLWGLVKHAVEEEGSDTTEFYYFPTVDSEAIKLGSSSSEGNGFYQIIVGEKNLDAETLKGKVSFLGDTGIKITAGDNDGIITISLDETSGFVLLDPPAESQTIKKNLTVEGDLTVGSESSLVTDKIKPSTETPVTVEGNETVTGELIVQEKLTAQQDVQVSGNLTVSVKGTIEDLVVNKTIENTNIFKTAQASDEGEAAKLELVEGVNFLVGNKFYIKPEAANFPATNIEGNLTGGEDISQHKLVGNSFTFDKGSFFITNDKEVSDLTAVTNQSPLIIGASNTTALRLEMSKNQIQTYQTDTEANTLNLNPHGGLVKIGDGGLEVGSIGVTIKGPLTVEGEATLSNNLTVSGDSTLAKALTVNGDITTTWFEGKSAEPTEGLTIKQKLVFGSKSITADGEADFTTLTVSGSGTFNSTLQVADDITFKTKILTSQSETSLAETETREPVSEIETRLVFDDEYLLSKSDLSDDGLIGKKLNEINSTISGNKKVLDELIVIAANVEGAPPEDVTTNTLIWIDIAEDMGSGVIHIKSGEDWVPVTSTWY